MADKFVPGTEPMKSNPRKGYTNPNTMDKQREHFSDPANIKEWLRPRQIDESLHAREEPEAPAFQQGGLAKPKLTGKPRETWANANPLPEEGTDADARRQLQNRLNVNDEMQTRENQRMGGVGTSRETMPQPPISVDYPPGNYSQGGRVKHGSDTVVLCKNKFG